MCKLGSQEVKTAEDVKQVVLKHGGVWVTLWDFSSDWRRVGDGACGDALLECCLRATEHPARAAEVLWWHRDAFAQGDVAGQSRGGFAKLLAISVYTG